MPKLLVVDDERPIRYALERAFGEKYRIVTAASVAEGVAAFRAEKPDVVVLDLNLPDGTGLEVFDAIRAADPRRPVLFITAHGTTDAAIEAMKHGAFDYLQKPIDVDTLEPLLEQAFEAARLMDVPTEVPDGEATDRLVGHSRAMQEMCKSIGRLAPQSVTVLIRGESGTGKELVARALYHHSPRAGKPFMALNCAAIPEQLLESELFGHEPGAFTGATKRRIGRFEQCNGGTLFLDEIGDMPMALQSKILRLLQEQKFERVGGTETIATDVRVIAATHQPLEQLIEGGKFRQDLFYRLNVVEIRIPPLRERPEDIPELANYFLFRLVRELGVTSRGFSPEAIEVLESYSWPGNVRELQSAVKHAALTCIGPTILPGFFPDAVRGVSPTPPAQLSSAEGFDFPSAVDELFRTAQGEVLSRCLAVVERVLIERALRETGGHQSKASDLLGLNRATLRYKLKQLGLSVEKVVSDDGDPPNTES